MIRLMMKPMVCGLAIGITALGATGAGAAQLAPPAPPPLAPMAVLPSFPPMPQLPPLPPMPALSPMAPMELIARIPPMPPMDLETMRLFAPFALAGEQSPDDLYDDARNLIEEGKYERALDRLNRLIGMSSTRTDAALYWKVYSLAKVGQGTDALNTLADLERRFKDSRWTKSAKALEVEIRQASGQPMSPETQNDEELKLYALRGLMANDPERALPMIEKLLAGTSSIKVKEQALFVLSQTRSTRARDLIAGIAKGGANPDLQLRAIRYIGMMGGAENRQILDEAYRASADPAVKRSIIRSFMTSGDRTRLLALAKTEKDDALRSEAVRQLGNMRAGAELSELYQSESTPEVRKQILQGLFNGGSLDKMIELAKTEKDPELKKAAIRYLGMSRKDSGGSAEALAAIYASDASGDVRKSVINALYTQNNAKTLVDLARAEKSLDLKKDIVAKLSTMKSKEAVDYMLELLK